MDNVKDRSEQTTSDLNWVQEHIGEVDFAIEQYALSTLHEAMQAYPTTIGKPLIEMASKNGGEPLPVCIVFAHTKTSKPCLQGSVLIINC